MTTGNEGLVVEGWEVSLTRSFSDHWRIMFRFNCEVPVCKPFRNPKKTNWEKFTKLVKGYLEKGEITQISKCPSI